jgi:hypothetical protein
MKLFRSNHCSADRGALMRLAAKIIAWVYLAGGAAAGFRVVLFAGPRYDLGLVVLFLLLGYGLLHFHPLARGVALLVSVPFVFGGVIGLALCIGHVAGLTVAPGTTIGGLSLDDQPMLEFVVLGVMLAFGSWQLWVLTRPDVAALFKKSTAADGK